MKRNLFNNEEITLCTFIARFGRKEFDETEIHKIKFRSIPSIKMKIQNIASMLHEQGFSTDILVSKLTGKPPGKKGRMTNWDVVEKLADMDKTEFIKICNNIIISI